jgi:hypothetical protein
MDYLGVEKTTDKIQVDEFSFLCGKMIKWKKEK